VLKRSVAVEKAKAEHEARLAAIDSQSPVHSEPSPRDLPE
jgi:hypothetical protein